MTPPTIGVVIPAYEVEQWLERCLLSVVEQSVPPDEIIVVDDGSTDATPEIAAGTAGVKLVQQANKNPGVARNTGTRTAGTDWIFFLDADDILLPGAIAMFLDAIAQWPASSMISPSYESEYPDGLIVRPAENSPRVYRRAEVGTVIRRNPFAGDVLMNREMAQKYPYDGDFRFAEDLDLWLRLLMDSHEIVRMGVPTTRRLIGRSGALSNQILAMRRARLRVFRKLWRDRRVSPVERALLVYQMARVWAGIAMERALAGGRD